MKNAQNTMETKDIHPARLLTVNEASDVMGISPAKLRELMKSGSIRTFKYFSQDRFPVWYLLEWQKEQMSLTSGYVSSVTK